MEEKKYGAPMIPPEQKRTARYRLNLPCAEKSALVKYCYSKGMQLVEVVEEAITLLIQRNAVERTKHTAEKTEWSSCDLNMTYQKKEVIKKFASKHKLSIAAVYRCALRDYFEQGREKDD